MLQRTEATLPIVLSSIKDWLLTPKCSEEGMAAGKAGSWAQMSKALPLPLSSCPSLFLHLLLYCPLLWLLWHSDKDDLWHRLPCSPANPGDKQPPPHWLHVETSWPGLGHMSSPKTPGPRVGCGRGSGCQHPIIILICCGVFLSSSFFKDCFVVLNTICPFLPSF